MKSIPLLLSLFALAIAAPAQENAEIPTAPEGYRRPEGYDPVPHRYKHSLTEMQNLFSEKTMRAAEALYDRLLKTNADGKWKPYMASLRRHTTPEWFSDVKFGMFIDWGPWSVAGWSPKSAGGASYADWYEKRMHQPKRADGALVRKYHEKNWGADFHRDDFIPLFKARNYQPEKLVDVALESGMKYIVPFIKGHNGFCLWPSAFTHRHTGVTLGKDLVKPLADASRAKGLKFGAYYSVDDWEHPIIDSDGKIIRRNSIWVSGDAKVRWEPYTPELETLASGKIPVENMAVHYIIPKAMELIDKYDPDILWFDGEWTTPTEDTGVYEIAAYYYNQAEGRKEVAINDRYGLDRHGLISGKKSLRGALGDYFTSEFGEVSDKIERHAWEECRGISTSYGFNWEDTDENVMSSKKFIDMFVDIVSRGGNLLLMTNLDAQGALPEVLETRLKDIGKWLKVNGEGIYNTRAYSTHSEGNVRYTRGKDNKTVYAISLEWPGTQLKLTSVKPAENSKIHMLGYAEPLNWSWQNGVTTIELPANLQNASNRPCEHAYIFRIRQ